MPFPPSDSQHPHTMPDGSVHEGAVFLNAVIDHPRIEIGEYSYAFDFDPPDDWAARLAPYLHPTSAERLVIGQFCQIANGVRFITASANHRYDGFTSYPFAIFDGMDDERPSLPTRFPDTIIGNDVWFGHGAIILPGARIGNGAIIGAGSVIGGTVQDYAIVAGNPGRVLRLRFAPEIVARLLEIAWWDWPIETILSREAEICGGDIAALTTAAGQG